MKISNFENALKMMEWRKSHHHNNSAIAEKIHENKITEREGKLKEFPCALMFEMAWETDEELRKWCWDNIGLYDCESCSDSVYFTPGCPVILDLIAKTPKIDDNEKYWEGIEDAHDAIEHGFQGIWTSLSFGKTGYDYGFIEYYFKNESDKEKVLSAITVLFPWATKV